MNVKMKEEKLLRNKRRATEEQNVQQLSDICTDLAGFYEKNEEYDKALNVYAELTELYEKLNRRMDKGKAYRMIGEMNILLGDYDEALKSTQIYLKCAKEENNLLEQQRAYATLGRVHLLIGQNMPDLVSGLTPLQSAEKAFLKSLLICNQLPSIISKLELHDMQARLYLNIGIAKEYMEEWDKSIESIQKSIVICQKNDFFELLFQCYFTISLLYHNKHNNPTDALKFINLGLKCAERLPNRVQKICEMLLIKSDIFIKMGDYQSAKLVLHKAYKMKTPELTDKNNIEKTLKVVAALCYTEDSLIITEQTDYKKMKNLYETMGDGSCKLQNYSKAIDYYLKMLNNAEANQDSDSELIPIYISLYQTYKDNKEYELALKYLWMEYEIHKKNPKEAIVSLINVADLYELMDKDFWDIDNILQRARTIAKSANNLQWERNVILKQIRVLKKYNMQGLLEILLEDIKMSNIKVPDNVTDIDTVSDDDVETDSENTVDNNTPDIGDDICLSDLSDSVSDDEEAIKPRAAKHRGFIIKKNNKGETQLHQACISGNLLLVRRLLDQGHAVNVRDNAGWQPLHEACNHGYKEIVELLLDHKAQINDKGGTNCDGITPLHDACVNGQLEIVNLLLDRGANATLRTDFGETPLDVLNKWYAQCSSTDLDPSEQFYFESIRTKLMDKLDKAGIKPSNNNQQEFLLNKNDDTINCRTRRSSALKLITNNINNKIGKPTQKSTTNPNNYQEKHKRNLRFSITGDSDTDDDGDLGNSTLKKNPSLSSLPFPTTGPAISSTNTFEVDDYRKTMDNLRTRTSTTIKTPLKLVEKNLNRPGYMDVNEIEYDNWLDDDVGPMKKKAKYLNDRIFDNEQKKSTVIQKRHSKSPIRKRNSFDSVASNSGQINDIDSINSAIEESNYIQSDNDSIDAFDVLMSNADSSTSKGVSKRKRQNSTTSKSKDKSSKQQTSLLDSGICRFRAESPSVTISSSGIVSGDSLSTTTRTSTFHSNISVKVKIDEQLLNVPINKDLVDDLTIGWLAEEAARRYYNLKGLRPTLQLATQDGAVFENSDPISLAFDLTTISSTVLEWDLPSLTQRYLEACNQFKCEPNISIQSILDLVHATQKLVITDQMVDPSISKPLFKSINYQSNLVSIDLSNNFIEDEGVKYLVNSLTTLTQLQSLNLSGNMISAQGIEYLSATIQNNDRKSVVLQELNELNLSFNPLKNQCVSHLMKFCENLRNLRKFFISSTEITDFFDYDLKFNQLTEFDISFNVFPRFKLRKCLTKLNACKLSKLNIAYCIIDSSINNQKISTLSDPIGNESTNDSVGKIITTLFDSGTCEHLHELNLSNCQLIDTDIWQIIQIINRSKNLEILSLQQNSAITSISFKMLLEKLSIKYLYLDGCNRIFENFSIDTFFDSIPIISDLRLTENITITLTDSTKRYEQLELLKRLWLKLCPKGYIFIKNLNVLLTAFSDTSKSNHFKGNRIQ